MLQTLMILRVGEGKISHVHMQSKRPIASKFNDVSVKLPQCYSQNSTRNLVFTERIWSPLDKISMSKQF